MTFFVFIGILLRVLKSEFDSSLVLAAPTEAEISAKQAEADRLKAEIDAKQKQYDDMNEEHSTAGDNFDEELERELGDKLEELFYELVDKREILEELLQ